MLAEQFFAGGSLLAAQLICLLCMQLIYWLCMQLTCWLLVQLIYWLRKQLICWLRMLAAQSYIMQLHVLAAQLATLSYAGCAITLCLCNSYVGCATLQEVHMLSTQFKEEKRQRIMANVAVTLNPTTQTLNLKP